MQLCVHDVLQIQKKTQEIVEEIIFAKILKFRELILAFRLLGNEN